MSAQNPVQARLKSLCWNYHKLAQEVAKIDPQKRSATTLYTTVRKVAQNPDRAQLDTLNRVVQAMGGEVVIKWHPVEEQEVTL